MIRSGYLFFARVVETFTRVCVRVLSHLQILDVLCFLFIMNINMKYAYDSYNILKTNKYTLISLMYFIVLW